MKAKLKISHEFHHIAQKVDQSQIATDTLSYGWDSFISVKIRDL